MNENMTKFYEAVSTDGKLQEELTVVTNGLRFDSVSETEARQATADAVARFAAEHDFDLTAADILDAGADVPEGELSEDELEAVSGGSCGCFVIGAASHCGCVIIGGVGDKGHLGCMMVYGD